MNNVEFPECTDIIEEMELVYKHDNTETFRCHFGWSKSFF